MIRNGNSCFGLHHLSVALESTPHCSRPLSCLFLSLGYDLAGLKKISLYLLEGINFPDIDKIPLGCFTSDQQPDVPKKLNGLYIPLRKNSLRLRIFKVHKVVKDIRITLSVLDENIVCSVLDKAYFSVLMLVPILDPYAELVQDEKYLLTLFESSFLKPLEVCSVSEIKDAVSLISSSKYTTDMVSQAIMIKVVQSFLALLQFQYESAFQGFNWVLEFCSALCKKQKYRKILPEREMRCVALLCSRSYMRCTSKVITLDGLSQRIFSILELSSNISIQKELLSGTLDHYFLTLGLLYQKRAILSSEESHDGYLQLLRDCLEEMIRKFIIAINLLSSDDGVLSRLYEDVLTGFVLYGGLHVKVLWAFKFLKDYFTLETNLHDCPYTGNYLENLSEFSAINKNMRFHLNDIVCTQGFLKGFDIDYDLIDDDSTTIFLTTSALVVRENDTLTMVKFVKETSPLIVKSHVREQIDKSNEFIDLWISSYKNYNGQIPNEVTEFFEKINIYVT